MLAFVITIIVAIIATIVGIKQGIDWGIKEGIVNFFISIFIGIFIGGLVFGISLGFCEPMMVEKKVEGEAIGIKGLQYQTEKESVSEGVFLLGFGEYKSGTKTHHTYSFFYMTEFGARLTYIDDEKYEVYIRESDEEEPNVKPLYEVKEFDGKLEKLYGENRNQKEIGRIITVPTNTIKIDYNVSIGE